MEHIPDTKSLFDVSQKVALITGASGGFGQASAKGLAKAGAKVMLTGRSGEKLEPVVMEIHEAGLVAAHVAGRPDDADDVKRIVDETVRHFGGIDILITAAGLSRVRWEGARPSQGQPSGSLPGCESPNSDMRLFFR